jgi:hypothetical protein
MSSVLLNRCGSHIISIYAVNSLGSVSESVDYSISINSPDLSPTRPVSPAPSSSPTPDVPSFSRSVVVATGSQTRLPTDSASRSELASPSASQAALPPSSASESESPSGSASESGVRSRSVSVTESGNEAPLPRDTASL